MNVFVGFAKPTTATRTLVGNSESQKRVRCGWLKKSIHRSLRENHNENIFVVVFCNRKDRPYTLILILGSLIMTVRVKNKARRDELNNSTFLVVPLLLIIVALLSVLLPLLPSANAAYTLEHKRTLVTGASGGIGAGIAKTLAQKGARVLVHYNTRRDGAEATAHETLLVREAAAAAVVHAAVVCCRRSRSTHTRSISEY